MIGLAGMIAGAKFVKSDNLPHKNEAAIGSANYSGRQVEEIIRFLETKYVGDVNADALVEKAIKAVLEGLDPHTHYFPPEQSEDLEEKTMGHYVGIGIEVLFIEDSLVVLYPKMHSPAEKAGIKPGDYIIAINKQPIPGDSLDHEKVLQMIKGNKGTRLKLLIKPMMSDSIHTVDIIRDEIKVPSVIAGYMLDTSVAYIKIARFTNTTYREFMDKWEELSTKHQAHNLVLDLRDNPGGYLREAVNILSQIFKEQGKLLVYTEGKNQQRIEYKSTGKVFFPVENICVLINGNSASASEIIAGCIQDHDRGIILGTRSYGKGLVQEQFDLSNGGTLRMTVSKYYTPSGRSIQKAYNKESVVDTALAFQTDAGRPVHPGGGIEPDILLDDGVHWDSPSVKEWMDIISEYAIRYNLEKYGGSLVSLDSIPSIKKSLPSHETILQQLSALAKIRSKENFTSLMTYLQTHQNMIFRIAEATLIAYRTGEEGWYRAFNSTDPLVIKAGQLAKDEMSTALLQK
jgi:carboxyl-terminal processing protease